MEKKIDVEIRKSIAIIKLTDSEKTEYKILAEEKSRFLPKKEKNPTQK